MSKNHGTGYTLGFAAAVCFVCSILVATSAVVLKDRQDANKQLDRQKNVLLATGLLSSDEDVSADDIRKRYEESIKSLVVTLETGDVNEEIDASSYDQRWAASDSSQSHAVDPNGAKVMRVANNALVYQVMKGEDLDMVVFPVRGKGLWSTMYAYLALDSDMTTIRGVSFYEHGETPGLGGEVENPKWTARWKGRKIFDAKWAPLFRVVKGAAGEVEEAPHKVDGMTGATLTSNGVTGLVQFWMGDDGFGPYLQKLRKQER